MKTTLNNISDVLHLADPETKKTLINRLIAIYTIVNNAMSVLINQQVAFPTFINKFEDVKDSVRAIRKQTIELIGEHSE